MFYFVDKEFDNLSLAGKSDALRSFLRKFQKELRTQQKLEEKEKDPELQIYRLKVLQPADTLDAIKERHRILRKRFIKYESEGKV